VAASVSAKRAVLATKPALGAKAAAGARRREAVASFIFFYQ